VEYLSPPYLSQPLLTYQLYDAFILVIQFQDSNMRTRVMSQLLDGTLKKNIETGLVSFRLHVIIINICFSFGEFFFDKYGFGGIKF
jgi:hypothetical protein